MRALWIAACLLALTGSAPARADSDDVYYEARLGGLDLGGKTIPAPTQSWNRRWRLRSALRPRAVLDGAGEAYVQVEWPRWFSRASDLASATLAVRVSKPREVRGTLFVPREDWKGMVRLRFRLPKESHRASARGAFLRALESTMSYHRDRGAAGAAWFRHRMREARRGRGKAPGDLAGPGGRPRRARRAGVDDTFELFSGGRAISENLQLGIALPNPAPDPGAEPVAIDSIQGIQVAEIDWEPLVKELSPERDPLARSIPADQHAIFFPDFASLTRLADEADERGTPILHLLEPRAEDAGTRRRYERQLCLETSALSRLLGPHVIASVAITGSDPYLRTGSDLAVLFETKRTAVLEQYLTAKHAAARLTARGVENRSGEVAGVAYRGVVSRGREVSSYTATLGKRVFVTNSLPQLKRLVRVTRGREPSLASLPEYTFFRGRYKRGAADETALLVLSDAAIRRWCGPRWRIGNSRRTRAAAVLSELQCAYARDLVAGRVEPGPLHTELSVPGGGSFRLTPGGVSSSRYGSLEFLTPIAELDLARATKPEAEAYRRWRDGYQRYWRRFFDPIAVRLDVREGRIEADLTVMPLIASSDYRDMIEVVGSSRLGPDSGDPHAGALAHYAMAIDSGSEPVKRFGGFLRMVTPRIETNPLAWVGSSLAIWADRDPYWEEVARSDDFQGFFSKSFHRIPVALRVEIASPLGAAAFLAALRAFVQQSAPGLTRWETVEKEGHTYVRIAPTEQAHLPDELEELAIRYATTPRALILTLREDVLLRALAREKAAGAKKEGAAGEKAAPGGGRAAPADPAPGPWLGESVAMRAGAGAARVLEGLGSEEVSAELQLRAWSALAILNEWRRLWPDRDPVAAHEKLWSVRLLSPGGGKYVWNDEWKTMESTLFGHPGAPRAPERIPWPIDDLRSAELGINFEHDGLRARARVDLSAVAEE